MLPGSLRFASGSVERVVGGNGVTPVDALLAQVRKNGGLSSLVDRIWTLPTLLWLGDAASVDAIGEAMCSAGAVLS